MSLVLVCLAARLTTVSLDAGYHVVQNIQRTNIHGFHSYSLKHECLYREFLDASQKSRKDKEVLMQPQKFFAHLKYLLQLS